MGHYYVAATSKHPLFQWMEADDPEAAIAKVMANPNGWTRNTLHGTEWDLRATEHTVPERYNEQFMAPPWEQSMQEEPEPTNVVGQTPAEIVAPLALVRLAYCEYSDALTTQAYTPPDWEHITINQRKAWRAAITAVLKEHAAS